MDDADADKLAFALLAAIKWAVDGGRVEQLPKVHEEISGALSALGRQAQQYVRRGRPRKLLYATVKGMVEQSGSVAAAATEMGVSVRSVYRCLKDGE